jgi:glucosylceramidase
MWLTTGDQFKLLAKQNIALNFTNSYNGTQTISVDSTQSYQSIDGFGFTLTGGSASLINAMQPAARSALLQELFGNADNAIGVSYLRVSIGASDLSASVYTYNDMPAGQTDPTLQNFTLSLDTVDVVPVLKAILAINPNIKILGSPWTAPVWMKDNNSSVGGSLQPQYYSVYAQYFVKYIKAMQAKGITIDAVTLQNEPMNPYNNPSMVMTSAQQATFIKNHVGPAFQAANITTKIIVWDHNADLYSYPMDVLNDAAAKPFVNGSAFHLYAGDINNLSLVRSAHPDKAIYFTEQYTASSGDFAGDLKWHIKNIIIGATRNWSRNALEWNLANNPSYGPHTNGGCTTCKGALTIGSGITRNVAYYIIAHAAKFVPAGSERIASNHSGSLYSVAFKTPAGKKVLIVLNDGTATQNFSIAYKSRYVPAQLAAGSVATFVW